MKTRNCHFWQVSFCVETPKVPFTSLQLQRKFFNKDKFCFDFHCFEFNFTGLHWVVFSQAQRVGVPLIFHVSLMRIEPLNFSSFRSGHTQQLWMALLRSKKTRLSPLLLLCVALPVGQIHGIRGMRHVKSLGCFFMLLMVLECSWSLELPSFWLYTWAVSFEAIRVKFAHSKSAVSSGFCRPGPPILKGKASSVFHHSSLDIIRKFNTDTVTCSSGSKNPSVFGIVHWKYVDLDHMPLVKTEYGTWGLSLAKV